jgi:hypothetical protein
MADAIGGQKKSAVTRFQELETQVRQWEASSSTENMSCTGPHRRGSCAFCPWSQPTCGPIAAPPPPPPFPLQWQQYELSVSKRAASMPHAMEPRRHDARGAARHLTLNPFDTPHSSSNGAVRRSSLEGHVALHAGISPSQLSSGGQGEGGFKPAGASPATWHTPATSAPAPKENLAPLFSRLSVYGSGGSAKPHTAAKTTFATAMPSSLQGSRVAGVAGGDGTSTADAVLHEASHAFLRQLEDAKGRYGAELAGLHSQLEGLMLQRDSVAAEVELQGAEVQGLKDQVGMWVRVRVRGPWQVAIRQGVGVGRGACGLCSSSASCSKKNKISTNE